MRSALLPGKTVVDEYDGIYYSTFPGEKKGRKVVRKELTVCARLINELVRKLMQDFPGFPEQPFFRHPKRFNRVKEGDIYGQHYLAKWWKRACKNLGVEGVPLYRGTKHSTVSALGDDFTPEEIKQATGHVSAAFERYFRPDSKNRKMIYAKAQGGSNTVSLKEARE